MARGWRRTFLARISESTTYPAFSVGAKFSRSRTRSATRRSTLWCGCRPHRGLHRSRWSRRRSRFWRFFLQLLQPILALLRLPLGIRRIIVLWWIIMIKGAEVNFKRDSRLVLATAFRTMVRICLFTVFLGWQTLQILLKTTVIPDSNFNIFSGKNSPAHPNQELNRALYTDWRFHWALMM